MSELRPVIQWLENGCDPLSAAKELRLLAARAAAQQEQHAVDANHAAIYRWLLRNAGAAANIIQAWCEDPDAGTDELHDALAQRAGQQTGERVNKS